MLQKNIEEGRLTPEKAFDLNDNVLNDYTFGSADSNGLRFDVLSSRQRVWVDGDTLQVQVIVGAAESNKKRQNHFVFYSEGYRVKAKSDAELNRRLQTIHRVVQRYSGNDTFDTPHKINFWKAPSLINHPQDGNLVEMLLNIAKSSQSPAHRHISLLLGSFDPSRNEGQRLIDTMDILRAQGYTISILALGNNNAYGLLRSAVGDDLNLATKNFDYDSWYRQIKRHRESVASELSLEIPEVPGAGPIEVLAPDRAQHSGSLQFNFKHMKTGDQEVLLLKLPIRPQTEGKTITMTFNLNYLDSQTKIYRRKQRRLEFDFVDRVNSPVQSPPFSVGKAVLALDTHHTLKRVSRFVARGRQLKAIAALTKQKKQIASFLEHHSDAELRTDTEIIDRYIQFLYSHDNRLLPSWRVFKDMTLSKRYDRF
ncbi:MAG: hypothetical protein HRU19_02105 [Pseudobacteriovorax sp.]|nr:hypothetical protein [Pseudobacteriovorax sp.]